MRHIIDPTHETFPSPRPLWSCKYKYELTTSISLINLSLSSSLCLFLSLSLSFIFVGRSDTVNLVGFYPISFPGHLVPRIRSPSAGLELPRDLAQPNDLTRMSTHQVDQPSHRYYLEESSQHSHSTTYNREAYCTNLTTVVFYCTASLLHSPLLYMFQL